MEPTPLPTLLHREEARTSCRNNRAPGRKTGLVILHKPVPQSSGALAVQNGWDTLLQRAKHHVGLCSGSNTRVTSFTDILEQVPVPWCPIPAVSGSQLGLLAHQTRLLFPWRCCHVVSSPMGHYPRHQVSRDSAEVTLQDSEELICICYRFSWELN